MDEQMMKRYTSAALDYTVRLLEKDSPSGCTGRATDEATAILNGLGFASVRLHKGGVLCELGGEGDALVLAAHVDTLGLMVTKIKPSGALRFTRIGGPSLCALETEEVRVLTRDGREIGGTVQMENASVHVNASLQTDARDEEHLEIVLDELVTSEKDTRALGVMPGDVVFINPRTRVTQSGFIKSRFLDDKLSAGMLLALAQAVKAGEVRLTRKVSIFLSVYEEVGHGASAGLPADTRDLLVVDMGCVGEHLSCRETQVSICAKDSAGPYDYQMTGEVIDAARAACADFAVDVYPRYSSDAATALHAGMDIRTALIGAGVYASHGYERAHKLGVENTLKLLFAFTQRG